MAPDSPAPLVAKAAFDCTFNSLRFWHIDGRAPANSSSSEETY